MGSAFLVLQQQCENESRNSRGPLLANPYLKAGSCVQNHVVILNALCFALMGEPEVRVLEERGIFDTRLTCTITRQVGDDGSVVWEEKSVETKTTSWTHEYQYAGNGDFVSMKHETVNGDRVDLFTVGVTDGSVIARMVRYANEPSNSALKLTEPASKMADPSRLWWVKMKPEVGAKVDTMTYLQMFGFYDVKVEYVGDETLTIRGKAYDTHKLYRRIDSMRTETWWVDDKGLPVQRHFWTNDENRPNRIDVIK